MDLQKSLENERLLGEISTLVDRKHEAFEYVLSESFFFSSPFSRLCYKHPDKESSRNTGTYLAPRPQR